MRILRNIIFILIAIIIIAVAIAYLLPQKVQVARSTDIAAPPSVVFPLVGDLRRSKDWYPWVAMDPDIKIAFSGPEVGVGQKMSWESAKVGNGSQTIVAYEPDTRVQATLDFGSAGQALTTMAVEPAGEGGSKVTWGFETDFGMNPIARYFGLAMERMVGPDFEKGLAQLKEMAEAKAAALPPAPETPSISNAPAEPETSAPATP